MNKKIAALEQVLTEFYAQAGIPEKLAAACSYSLMAGGKRIRPLLFLDLLESFGIELKKSHYLIAAAVEMIHTGSLIHDDLPAMDDDDYRRGRLTSHKQFDEATAILAGDSLFLDPYALLAQAELPAEQVVQLVAELSYASGSLGMVAGQVLDMAGEGKSLNLTEIEQIHKLKTGRLLTFPFVAAAIVAGKDIEKARETGQKLGLAFQIRDDILDVTATFEELGKTPGKDIVEEKSTYVSLLGLDGARAAFEKEIRDVKKNLSELLSYEQSSIQEIIESLEI